MTDLQQKESADATGSSPEPQPSLGKNIVRSFKNRSKRMNSEKPAIEVTPIEETAPISAPPLIAVPAEPPAPPVEAVPPAPEPDPSPMSAPPEYLPAVGTKPVSVPLVTPKVESKKQPTRPKTRHSRRARLRISRVDPWSVMKTALLFSVAGWIIFIVATWVVFTVLDQTGLYGAINDTVAQIFASPDATATFNIQEYVNTTRATAIAALVGAVNVVIMTALATIFAFLYNLSAVVMGGIEVTMAED